MRRHRLPVAGVHGLMAFAMLLAIGLVEHPAGREPVLSPWLETALRQARSDARHVVWIYFRDKGPAGTSGSASSGAKVVGSRRAQARRAVRGRWSPLAAFEDRTLDTGYVDTITASVLRVRQRSRWLNAVSAEATASQVAAIARLPFVAKIDVVKRYRRLREEPLEPLAVRARPRGADETVAPEEGSIDYGYSHDQLAQIRVPELHARGLQGEGIVIAVFDSGFPNLAHEVFESMTILGERDFVSGAETVRDSTNAHGTNTLSVIGGFRDGRLVGPAHRASFLLAVTEDAGSETPVEEDNWAAAAEWAEALGADVISSSLGYLDFDLPFTSYSDRDMDGETAITTRAAAMAAARGVVVVSSAGNGGFSAEGNTLGAPADGRQVLSVGAVDRSGLRAAFSSVGPTADGRIKPDVAALGVRAVVASAAAPDYYSLASGTSFSCPLAAGVVALVLEARPTYTVDQVLEVLRSTAGQAGQPDNLLGWGILDAVAAVDMELPPPLPAESVMRHPAPELIR